MESLEDRRLFAVAAQEQEFVYLLNRARHDPAAYAQEVNLGVDLSSVTPRPPLAVNDQLFGSAGFHAEEMAEFDYFGHQSDVTGDWPNKMARDAGYPLPPGWPDDNNFIESLTAGQTAAAAALRALIHDGGGATGGHRTHLLGMNDFWGADREIGVGYAFDSEATYRHYWAIHPAHRATPAQYLTGVVFSDANHNQRYDAGEGQSGVTVSAGELSTATNAQGGWSLPAPNGEYLLTASGGAFQGDATVPVLMQGQNIEIDFLSGKAGGHINFEPWVNSAPVLDDAGDLTLQPVVRGDSNPPGNVAVSLLEGRASDADPASLQGIAIVGADGTATGEWQYSINGGAAWNSLTGVSLSAARLLRDTDLVRFVPDANSAGAATLTFHAWDRTSGEVGSTANLASNTGGASPFSTAADSATMTVLAANTAPVLTPTGDRILPAIPEDSTSPAGALVREILGPTATDPDPGTKLGAAVITAEGSNGQWQYSTDGGATWGDVGTVSTTAAILLRDIDRLRFIPVADYHGSPTISYYAWDQMSGAAGQKVSLAAAGGSVSVASDTASITVTPVNDAPVLDPGGQPKIAPIPVDPTANPPQLISSILGNVVSDVDEGALEGIAVTGVTGNGQWWFINDGQGQSGSTTPHFAWLLKATDRIQFVPAAGWSGNAGFTFRAWDQTTGPETSGVWANVSDPSRYGGTKAYSATELTATLFVGPAGEAPTVQSIVRADANPTAQTSLTFDVAFSEDVVNVDPSDFHVVAGGTVTGEVTAVSGSGSSYAVTVTNLTGEGTLGVAFAPERDIKDAIGNPLDLAGFAGSEVYDVEILQLTLSLAPAVSSEAALITASFGTVTRTGGNLAAPLTVSVVSSDPGEAAVEPTVVIPAGETSATFLVEAVDDDLLDGPQTVEISVASPGYFGDSSSLTITDHETLTVTLETASLAETAATALATVQRSNTDNSQALLVTLTSSDPGEASVPATVLIPAGAGAATFALDAIHDGVRDGTQHITITAAAAGYLSPAATLEVIDSDDQEEITPPWQNPGLRWDVDGSGEVEIADLLMLVADLREHHGQHDLPLDGGRQAPYLDIDGDDRATLGDLLDLVERLREGLNGG